MTNTGVTGIFLARQVWKQTSLVLHETVLEHVAAQATLTQDILRDEGLGHVEHGNDWDLLGKARLDELPLSSVQPYSSTWMPKPPSR